MFERIAQLIKPKNPLVREQEIIADRICKELRNLSFPAKDEILGIVHKNIYPEPVHIHRNPKKKKDTSYESSMDSATKYSDKYKGY